MQLFAVATDAEGRRYELALTLPDECAVAMDTNGLRGALQYTLQTEVDRCGVNAAVALRDREAARQRAAAPADDIRGPDQIAFAGTKESVPVPNTGTHAHEEALQLARRRAKGGTRG